MRKITSVTIALLCWGWAGCASQGKLRVTTSPAIPAELTFSSTGKHRRSGSSGHCPLPCDVEIPFRDTYELTIRAPGYFPAVVQIPGEAAAWYNTAHSDGTFVVPLLPRAQAE